MAVGVGSPPKRTRSRESFMGAGRGRDALLEGWEESGGTSREPGVVGKVWRPAQRAGRGREAHLERREGSIGKEEYRRPSWRAGKGREAFTEGREGYGGPAGMMGGVGKPS